MTDATDAAEHGSDERPSGLSASGYVLVLALLLLCGTALALAAADAETANAVGTIAYWALAVGVALRLAEYAGLGQRLRWLAGFGRTLGGRSLERAPAGLRRIAPPTARFRRALHRGSASFRRLPLLDSAVEEGIRLSMPLTVLAGGLFVAWLWLDPARTVSVWFLAGWAVAILAQLWLSSVVPALRRA